MKSKFTFLVGLLFLTTSIYAAKQIDEKKDSFSKNRIGMFGKSKEHNSFQRRINFKNQEVQLKSAQAIKQRLDSFTNVEWDDFTSQWITDYKAEFIYDGNWNVIQSLDYELDESTDQLILYYKSDLSYDTQGNIIQDIYYELDENTNQFAVNGMYNYSYDANGNMTQSKSYHSDSDNILIQYSQYDLIYGTNGKLLQEIGSYLNENTSQLEAQYKTDYTYNANGKETQNINYYWDSYTSNQWQPSSKTESTYDSQGNLIISLESSANDLNNTLTWDLNRKDENTYDIKGQLIQNLNYNMNINGIWMIYSKQVYVFDDSGNNIQSLDYYDWDNETNQWNEIYKEETTFDNRYTRNDLLLPFGEDNDFFTHMIIEMKGFNWDSSLGEWTSDYQSTFAYSSQNVTAVNQIDAGLVNVYPNPFSEYVSVSFPGNYSQVSFELFDMQGRKIMSKQISSNAKVSMEEFGSGMYLYKLNMDGKVQSGKLVKE